MTEPIIINGDLSCDNCPEYHKKRCKEQQEKKNNIIKNIINNIVDIANICGCDIKKETEFLFQQITNVTRCDVVLEKQLKRKEQECEKYKKCINDVKELAKIALEDDDKPACVYDDDCPLNNGVGFDNHCDLTCPYIISKKIVDKINEVENEY